MKKPKVIYHNNNKSNHNLVLHRLFFKKKDILGLYSYKLRVFLKALLSRRCSNQSKLSFVKESLAKKTSKKTELKVNSNSVLDNYIKNVRNIRVAGITSSFLLILLSFSILIPIYNRTNSVEAVTGTSKQSDTELSITTSSNVAGVDLLVKDNNGTFASSDDSGNILGFNVATNNYTGYTLTITNKSSSTDLVNNDVSSSNGESSNTFTSISSTISSTTFDTTTYNGKWGYLPSRYCTSTTISSCTNNTSYRPSPTTTASTLDITNTPNTTAKEYTIGIGARADYTKPAGVYSNTYILQAVGNPVGYSITYADNTNDSSVANLPYFNGDTSNHVQSGSVSTTSITLSSIVPARTGYTFKSWCLGTVSNNGTTCTKDASLPDGADYEFDAGGNFGIDQTITNTTTLYAKWTPNIYNLVISADDNVSSMTVKTGSASGASTTCNKSGTTFTCSGLTYGVNYYLYPVFASGYEFSSWAKTDSVTNAVLGSTTAVNTYYKMGAGAGALKLTSKSSCSGSVITFKTNNATSISLFSDDSLATKADYTNNQTACVANGTYYIYGNFSDSYMFSSWATTAGGELLSSSSRTTTITVSGSTTLTLTGRAAAKVYMQDITLADCQNLASDADYTIIDRRDNNRYTVRYINGACWMTQNLRLAGGTELNSTYSNISSSYYTYIIPATDLTSGNTYTEGRIHNSGDEVRGYWYNYCVASVGLACQEAKANASQSICPKNWSLPITVSTLNYDFNRVISYKATFGPIYGGYYDNGSLYDSTPYGGWWSSQARTAWNQYSLQYEDGSLEITHYVGSKNRGFYVRCVHP